MSDRKAYRGALANIRDYLARFDDKHWLPILNEWLSELDRITSNEELAVHLARTLKATGGMGSLGDLAITPLNGHNIANDPAITRRASETLWRMTSDLYERAKKLELLL